jgi:protein required for attachment to host cells
MKIDIDIDLEKFRISLVGDGYIKEEVEQMTEEELVLIFKQRTLGQVEREYSKSLRICY